MSMFDIIRAWKDEEYRNSLSESERAALPQHPAGEIELSDVELETVAGGGIFTVLSFCFWDPCRTH